VIHKLIAQLQRCIEDPSQVHSLHSYAGQLASLEAEQAQQLFRALARLAADCDDDSWHQMFATLLGPIRLDAGVRWPGHASIDPIVELYRLCPGDGRLRNLLLGYLAKIDTPDSFRLWTQLLCEDPPLTSHSIGNAFQPLLASSAHWDSAKLRTLIDRATGNLHVAAAVYDLANHAVRSGKIDDHPAGHRRTQICELLGALIHKLSQIEDGFLPQGESPASIAATISDAVSLIVALIDTVALLHEQQAAGKLRTAAELRHRRIQVEAAAALARLGAAEPGTRQRAIAYARELGIAHEISLEYMGPIATAESCLAMWLSLPEQMGLAPTEIRLLDQRKLYWPGYEVPQDCFLFEYRYGRDANAHVNVGMSGPATHAFFADLTPLSVEDQYAAFAGWQTWSDEIYLIPIERAEEALAAHAARLKTRLIENSPSDVTLQAMLSFFGTHALIASANTNGTRGTWIVDEQSTELIPAHNEAAPIDWRLALDIWKGRRGLATFNPTVSH